MYEEVLKSSLPDHYIHKKKKMMFGHDWEMGWVKNFLEPLRTVSQRGKETSQPCILRK